MNHLELTTSRTRARVAPRLRFTAVVALLVAGCGRPGSSADPVDAAASTSAADAAPDAVADATPDAIGPDFPCTSNLACKPELPRCDLEQHACAACIAEADCAAYPSQPHCGDAGACVGCRDTADCALGGGTCDLATRRCQCTRGDECPSGVCDPQRSRCVREADVVYVDSAGTGTACTRVSPCQDLATAHGQVTDTRSRVLVAPGTYGAAALVGKRYSIEGAGAVVTGSLSVRDADVAIAGLAIHGGGLTIRGGSARLTDMLVRGDGASAGVPGIRVRDGVVVAHRLVVERGQPNLSIEDNADITLEGSQVRDGGGAAVHVATNRRVVLRRNRVVGNQGGILLMGRPEVVIVNNLIYRNGWGVFIVTSPHGLQLEHNTITANTAAPGLTAAGVACPLGGTIGPLRNNIIHGNHGGPPVSGDCSHVFSLIAPDAPPGEGNLDADPDFADAADSYAISATSPARDRADPARIRAAPFMTVDDDIAGRARPQGDRADIGAYEVAP